MKHLLPGLLLLVLLPVPAMGQSPFDGTWTIDMSTVKFPEKPDVYVLQNGMYECKTCAPPIKIKADGSDQNVAGHPYFDAMAVKAVDDHSVESTTKRGGKVVGTEKDVISEDGNSMTGTWTDSGQPSGGTQNGTFTAKRVAKGPSGAHLLSGSWRTEKGDASASALTWTYKVSGNELNMTNPTGQSYTAKVDGTEAPYNGDPGTTTVSVKVQGNTLTETDKRNGKVIGILKMVVESDGKTAKATYDDKLHGTTIAADARKQ
jgi:hypothetical protein